MPTATIDSKGSQFFYTDSGPVPGSSDYTTLVIYHGSAFTGDTFHKLLPLGAKDNVRLVILNRRDYAGSSKYTDAELDDLNAARKTALERIALDVANFLVWFVDTQHPPPASADGKTGGLALMGWSLGNAMPLALFAHPEVVPKETYAKLEPYVRLLILYDPPFLTFGHDQPPDVYSPFTDPAFKTPQEIFDNFQYWVSGYYDHPDLGSRTVRGMDFSKRGKDASAGHFTPKEMAKNYDGLAAARTEAPMIFNMKNVLRQQAQRALFDEEMVRTILPRTKVVHQYCTRTNWFCAYGFIETERQYKEQLAQGKKVRPIAFQEIKEANHFVHWDDPERFWKATAEAIHGNLH